MYMVAMATRLKRKVFLSKNIRKDVLALSCKAAAEYGTDVISYAFIPYGMELVLDCATEEAARRTAKAIRYATSGTVRKRYPELWSMPSFWTRDCLVIEWAEQGNTRKTLDDFYASLKSR